MTVEQPVSEPVDVCIAGGGPVGLVLALALRKHCPSLKVVIVEKQAKRYPLPRAVCLDHESLRIMHWLGLGTKIEKLLQPWLRFTWVDANLDLIVDLGWERPSVSGHFYSSGFSQPHLEALLEETALERGVRIIRSWVLTDAEQDAVHVRARLVPARDAFNSGLPLSSTLHCQYLIGCDGANSTVRKLAGLTSTDLGFSSDWLVADVIPLDGVPQKLKDVGAIQLCDPARPTTVVHGGPGRERLEFMRLPGESPENLLASIWVLLEPWGLTPDNCVLERKVVYTFKARWADSFQQGRILLAGDAAHLMPPFIGQGMNSGFRDSTSLAWRLEAIIRQGWSQDLLKSYTSERRGHVESITRVAVKLGEAICMTDPEQALKLHAALREEAVPPAQHRLDVPGLFLADDPYAGFLSFNRKLNLSGKNGWIDTRYGQGWTLLSTSKDASCYMSARGHDWFLQKLHGTHIHLNSGLDTEGEYSTWFKELGAEAALVRPDFYIFFTCTLAGLGVAVERAMTILDF